MAILSYTCKHCKTNIERNTTWIDPTAFSKKPHSKVVFWCSNRECQSAIALTVEMKPNNIIKVIREENTADIYDAQRDDTIINARPRSKK